MIMRCNATREGRLVAVLAAPYLARYESRFEAYMALQSALVRQYIRRGGSAEEWCRRLAPVYRRRYGPVFAQEPGTHALPARGAVPAHAPSAVGPSRNRARECPGSNLDER
jgi:hypothetical protein